MAEISVLIEGGKATAAAPLGPALGPLGVNIGEIVDKINEKTKPFSGMKVPVKVDVDSSTKEFEIKVGSPPTSAVIKKELNLKTASGNPKEFVGNMTMDQILKVAEMKIDNINSYSMKSAVNEILGTCNSMGISVDNKRANEVIADVKAGKYNNLFKDPEMDAEAEALTEEIPEAKAEPEPAEAKEETEPVKQETHEEKEEKEDAEAEALMEEKK